MHFSLTDVFYLGGLRRLGSSCIWLSMVLGFLFISLNPIFLPSVSSANDTSLKAITFLAVTTVPSCICTHLCGFITNVSFSYNFLQSMYHAVLNNASNIASPCLTPVDTLKGLLPVIATSTMDILSFSVIFISFIILLVCHNILKREIIDILSCYQKLVRSH